MKNDFGGGEVALVSVLLPNDAIFICVIAHYVYLLCVSLVLDNIYIYIYVVGFF